MAKRCRADTRRYSPEAQRKKATRPQGEKENETNSKRAKGLGLPLPGFSTRGAISNETGAATQLAGGIPQRTAREYSAILD
jgi:hypothetical protein